VENLGDFREILAFLSQLLHVRVALISGISFIIYAQGQNIGKPNICYILGSKKTKKLLILKIQDIKLIICNSSNNLSLVSLSACFYANRFSKMAAKIEHYLTNLWKMYK
jgi:hypothetical protein